MSFLRSGLIYAVANTASAAVPFLFLPLLTRVLSPDEYGLVVGFSLLITLFSAFSGLNVHAALGVLWFDRPQSLMPSYTGLALVLAFTSSLLVAAFAALLFFIWPGLISGITSGWAVLAALTAGANVILQCRLVLWQSQNKPLKNASLQILSCVLNIGLSLFFVLALGLGGAGRNEGIFMAAVLMALLSVILFCRVGDVRWQFDRRQMKDLVTFGSPLILHSLAGVLIGTADRWSVSVHLGTHELGVYGAGAQLGMVMGVLADAFVKAYGPWVYAKLASNDKQAVVGAVYVSMPVFFIIAAAVGSLLQLSCALLLGARYQEASSLLPWFMVGGAFTGVYLCTSVLFFFSARTALLSLVTSSAAICGALSTWLLSIYHGIEGAAIGYALTQALLALFTTVVAIKSFELPWNEPGKALRAWSVRVLPSLASKSSNLN